MKESAEQRLLRIVDLTCTSITFFPIICRFTGVIPGRQKNAHLREAVSSDCLDEHIHTNITNTNPPLVFEAHLHNECQAYRFPAHRQQI